MYVTMSTSTGLYPNLDLENVNNLHYINPNPANVENMVSS